MGTLLLLITYYKGKLQIRVKRYSAEPQPRTGDGSEEMGKKGHQEELGDLVSVPRGLVPKTFSKKILISVPSSSSVDISNQFSLGKSTFL